jgi:CheY-like chemotaxis protein
MNELIAKNFSEKALTEAAVRAGMTSLLSSGLQKVAQGQTTLEEVAGVVGLETKGPGAAAAAAAPSDKLRVLVADDEEDILKVEVWHLDKAGYHVIRARDGAELVEKAVREKPDMIITDVTMPKMTGFEATRMLRSRLETAAIPILMLTARSDKESELEGLDAGADDYMTKPFDSEKLLARVKILLKRAHR